MNVPTVLIVEDEALLREVNAMEFEDAGFRVVAAANGDEALAALGGGDPGINVMFTDISLRDSIDGWTIAEQARVLRPDLAVIYATGQAPYPGRVVAGALYFQKPFLATDVIAAALEMLSHLSLKGRGFVPALP